MTDQTPRTFSGYQWFDDATGRWVVGVDDAQTFVAQARAEVLDVEVLARAIERACADHNQDCWFRSSSRLGAEAILRAILAARRDEG